MTWRLSHLRSSLLLSAGSLLVAAGSLMLGRRVNYLHHLALFNAMAALMLALAGAALAVGVAGAWHSRGRSAGLWLAVALASLVLANYLFDS